MDPQISQVKNNLLGKSNYNTFILRNGVVCKIFSTKHIGPNPYAIYIPTTILTAVVIYIHKHYGHTSKTQTFREFASLYFHPRAKQVITDICRNCITCSTNRNVEYKNITVG